MDSQAPQFPRWVWMLQEVPSSISGWTDRTDNDSMIKRIQMIWRSNEILMQSSNQIPPIVVQSLKTKVSIIKMICNVPLTGGFSTNDGAQSV